MLFIYFAKTVTTDTLPKAIENYFQICIGNIIIFDPGKNVVQKLLADKYSLKLNVIFYYLKHFKLKMELFQK